MIPRSPTAVFIFAGLVLGTLPAQTIRSSRVNDPNQHVCTDLRSSPYRRHLKYVLAELDLAPGDTVVDIGAGDGWWAQRMAAVVGETGKVNAAEVDEKKIARMRRKFAKIPQIRPYLCPPEGPGLAADSCDLVFLAQTYHHLPKDRVAYLRGLKKAVKPTGRICIIERYPDIAVRNKSHSTAPHELMAAAAKAGWVLLRFELIPNTNHYLTIFVQKELFHLERQQRRRRSGREPSPRS